MQYCYIVGSKGFGNYGGYETFVDKLTEYHRDNENIKYFVACKSNENSTFVHNNAVGFNIKVPNIGAAQAIYYDVKALQWCIDHIRENHVEHPIVYILACRIGPYAKYFKKEIHQLGGKLYVNPDGGYEIIESTGEKPVKSRLPRDSVFYHNPSPEHQTISYSGFLGLFAMPVATSEMRRVFCILKIPENR